MKKKLIALTLATLLLTSCGAITEVKMVETNTKLKDGRTVTCIAAFGESAAVSCDWETAK